MKNRQQNGQKKRDKQRSHKYTHKTKDRVIQTPLKTGVNSSAFIFHGNITDLHHRNSPVRHVIPIYHQQQRQHVLFQLKDTANRKLRSRKW